MYVCVCVCLWVDVQCRGVVCMFWLPFGAPPSEPIEMKLGVKEFWANMRVDSSEATVRGDTPLAASHSNAEDH